MCTSKVFKLLISRGYEKFCLTVSEEKRNNRGAFSDLAKIRSRNKLEMRLSNPTFLYSPGWQMQTALCIQLASKSSAWQSGCSSRETKIDSSRSFLVFMPPPFFSATFQMQKKGCSFKGLYSLQRRTFWELLNDFEHSCDEAMHA